VLLIESDCFNRCCDCGAVVRPKDECIKDGDLYYCTICTQKIKEELYNARKEEGYEYYDKELDDAGWYDSQNEVQNEVPWFTEQELQDMYLVRRKENDNTIKDEPQKVQWFSKKRLNEICDKAQEDYGEIAKHKRSEILKEINQNIGQPGIICEAIQMLKDIDDIIVNQDCIITAFENTIIAPDSTVIDLRGGLEKLIKHIIKGNKGKIGVKDQGSICKNIEMLYHNKVIPPIVKNHMDAIRVICNHVHFNNHKELKYWDVYPMILSFVAILKWVSSTGKIEPISF
jgi:hypothetical protein